MVQDAARGLDFVTVKLLYTLERFKRAVEPWFEVDKALFSSCTKRFEQQPSLIEITSYFATVDGCAD